MPRSDYVRCKDCGGQAKDVGELSHTRLCAACGVRRRNTEVLELVNHRGPYFDHWRRRGAASYGAVLLDDLLPDA